MRMSVAAAGEIRDGLLAVLELTQSFCATPPEEQTAERAADCIAQRGIILERLAASGGMAAIAEALRSVPEVAAIGDEIEGIRASLAAADAEFEQVMSARRALVGEELAGMNRSARVIQAYTR